MNTNKQLIVAGAAAVIGSRFAPSSARQYLLLGGLGAVAAGVVLSIVDTAFDDVKNAGGAVFDYLTDAPGLKSEDSIPSIDEILQKGIPELPHADKAPKQEGGMQLGKANIVANIVTPANNSTASRSYFSSTIDVVFELTNVSSNALDVSVDVALEVFRSFADNTKTLTPFGKIKLAPGETRRLSGDVDTGDVNLGLFETGAGSAALFVKVNNLILASNTFYIT